MKIKNRFRLSLNQKKAFNGFMFTLLFLIGFSLFFLYPLIQSILFSLSKLKMTPDGFELSYIGIQNFQEILFVNAKFLRTFIESILKTIIDIPAIIMFSFFIAVILNQRFRGRTLARIIFFLPVILTAGVIFEVQQNDYLFNAMGIGEISNNTADASFAGAAVRMFLLQLKIPEVLINYIIGVVSRLTWIVNASAIPILIFLAGLQSIPASLYEASKMEGATAWENFWKITFPMMTPLLLTNVVYVIVNSFTSPDNELVRLIQQITWESGTNGFGLGAAMSWFYFLAIVSILVITAKVLANRIFYMK